MQLSEYLYHQQNWYSIPIIKCIKDSHNISRLIFFYSENKNFLLPVRCKLWKYGPSHIKLLFYHSDENLTHQTWWKSLPLGLLTSCSMDSRMEVSYLWRVFCESRVTRGDLVRLTSPWWPFVKTTRTGTNCPEKQSLWPFEDNNMNLYPTKWTIALRDKTREHDCSPQSPLVDDVLFHCFVLWLFIPLDQVGDIQLVMKAVLVKKKTVPNLPLQM